MLYIDCVTYYSRSFKNLRALLERSYKITFSPFVRMLNVDINRNIYEILWKKERVFLCNFDLILSSFLYRKHRGGKCASMSLFKSETNRHVKHHILYYKPIHTLHTCCCGVNDKKNYTCINHVNDPAVTICSVTSTLAVFGFGSTQNSFQLYHSVMQS